MLPTIRFLWVRLGPGGRRDKGNQGGGHTPGGKAWAAAWPLIPKTGAMGFCPDEQPALPLPCLILSPQDRDWGAEMNDICTWSRRFLLLPLRGEKRESFLWANLETPLPFSSPYSLGAFFFHCWLGFHVPSAGQANPAPNPLLPFLPWLHAPKFYPQNTILLVIWFQLD